MLFFAYLLLPVRIVLVIIAVILGFSAQLVLFWWVSRNTVRSIVGFWSKTMLACFGVGIIIERSPASTAHTALVVSNHISWLDILALQAVYPVVFVAKSEIKSWPVLGWMVSLAGTCFIERSRRTALRTVHTTLTAHLQAGQSVCIFPEGTTTDGQQVLPFHAGLLQAAIAAGVPVQPMRLHYSHSAAAYIDDRTLLGSMGSILLAPRLKVQVIALNSLNSEGATRQSLGAQAYAAITQTKI